MDIKEKTLSIIDDLKAINPDSIQIDADMSKNTSFKTGGPADILIKPKSTQAIIDTINVCKSNEIPFTIIGNGSNLLVKDGGIRGVVIKISNNLNDIQLSGTKLRVQAGAMLPIIGQLALKNELTGFEFAAGIPGTVGGAMVMNAGAHGGEMKDIVTKVIALDYNGDIKVLSTSDMQFGYRTSILHHTDLIVLEVEFELKQGNKDEIKEKMDNLKEKRINTQPLSYPNAGSTFKRPLNNFAGKLIEDAGLKGLTIGGAQVSTKHAGFIVNIGNATTKDILRLIKVVKLVVNSYYDIDLQEEVKIIGEDL